LAAANDAECGDPDMHVTKNIADWERIASIAVGTALIVTAVKRRRLLDGALVAGIACLARGSSGYCPVSQAFGRSSRHDDTRAALGGDAGTRLKASVTIAKEPAEVFAFWRDLENLPRFMRHLERVEALTSGTTRGITRWTWRGPGGIAVTWDAEIINEIRPELIAWRSLPGADLVSAGSVRFKDIGDRGTEVTVSMQYAPPGGALGNAVSWLSGRAPLSELQEDLRRLKRLLETGAEPTTAGQSAGVRSRLFRAAEGLR
jgi:uncharacterized membrane protein